MMIDNAEARKPYETKTISEIKMGEESPIIAKMKADAVSEYIKSQEMKSVNVGVKDVPIKTPEEVVKKVEAEVKKKSKKVKEFAGV